MKNNLTLFLMTQKGLESLKAIASGFPGLTRSVVSARDPHVQKDYYDEIRDCCSSFGLPFHDRSEGVRPESGYAIAISWRWIIPLGSCRLIIFHDSLLPRYRGFNPLVSALINGESKVGVTALFATEEYDRGDIIARSEIPIAYPIRIQEAINRITACYSELSVFVAGMIAGGGELVGSRQDENGASYSLWRDEDDYRVDWSRSSCEIRRRIDAVGFPYKGASTFLAGRKARVLAAEEVPDVRIENRTPGKVIFMVMNQPVVVCGSGLLKITEFIDDETGMSLLPLKNFRTRLE